jgi:anti-anti-sigma factor
MSGRARKKTRATVSPTRPKPQVTREAGRVVVGLTGELDRSTRPVLPEHIVTGLLLDGHDIIIDLRDVEFLDLGVVRDLAREKEFFASHDLDMTVRAPRRLANRMLLLCALEGMIDQTIDLRSGRRPPLRKRIASPRSSAG